LVEEESFQFRMKLRQRYSQNGAGLIDPGRVDKELVDEAA